MTRGGALVSSPGMVVGDARRAGRGGRREEDCWSESVKIDEASETSGKRQQRSTVDSKGKGSFGWGVGDGGGFSSTFVGATRLLLDWIATTHRL